MAYGSFLDLKRNTAIHEAGHAITVVLNGGTIKDIRLTIGDASQRGSVNFDFDNDGSEEAVKKLMQIGLASSAALNIIGVQQSTREDMDILADICEVGNLAAKLCRDDYGFPDEQAMKRLEAEMYEEVKRKLLGESDRLLALVDALEGLDPYTGVLSKDDILRVIREVRV